MISDTVVTREEHLQRLAAFCRALDTALGRVGVASEKSVEAWCAAVAGKCVQCGFEVSGEELFALSQRPSAEHASAKIGRLRLGDCACKGCTSYYYRLTFAPYQELKWSEILAQVQTLMEEQAQEASSRPAGKTRLVSILWRSPAARRVGAGFLLILVLLLMRQWYIGGRIPLLREPEKFHAAPESTSNSIGR